MKLTRCPISHRILFFTLLCPLLLTWGGCKDEGDHPKCEPDSNKLPVGLYSTTLTHRDGTTQKVTYEERNGLAFIQGDIAIGTAEEVRQLGSVTTGDFWTDGIVYYDLPQDFPEADRLTQAMQTWTTGTGGRIQFKARTNESNYISFVRKESACWSYIGMTGGKQELNLGDKCGPDVAIHELGHALGLWHEQSRGDRDDFVEVLWCNIKENQRHNFEKSSGKDVGPYDYFSIMHYGAADFAKSWNLFTLRSKTDTPVPVQSAAWPSQTDYDSVICSYDSLVECPGRSPPPEQAKP